MTHAHRRPGRSDPIRGNLTEASRGQMLVRAGSSGGRMTGERDVSFARARDLVGAHAVPPRAHAVPVRDAAGRRLASDIRACADHPPFANSAMDGWAIDSSAAPGPMRIVGASVAGAAFAGRLGTGEAIAIATGAPLPAGADAIVPREAARRDGDVVVVPEPVAPGAWVRRRGDAMHAGDVVLRAGQRLGPFQLAAAAGAGHAQLACVVPPRVAVVVTGRELVPVGVRPGPSEVWDITGVALPAMVIASGGEPVWSATIGDDRAATIAALEVALDGCELVVTTGGVSVGDEDHVRPTLAELGVEEIFREVRIRPGHPTWFGRRGDVRVLALPGNPVASAVCFWMFARPLLGCQDAWVARSLGADYTSGTARTDLIRCVDGPDGLVPAVGQASHHISALATATHLAVIPEGRGDLRTGDRVDAVALAW